MEINLRINRLERLLVGIPWFLIIIAITVIAWRWGGWQLSFWNVGGMLLIGMLGLWVPAMSFFKGNFGGYAEKKLYPPYNNI